MIRQPDSCPTDAIQSLLRDELDNQDHESVAAHLDSCVSCQQLLERNLTQESLLREAQRFVKDETAVAALSPDSTLAHIRPTSSDQAFASQDSQGPIHSQQGNWVLGLLQPATQPGFIGRIGNMDVMRVIGQGGMGVVLQAWDRELQRDLAVKLLSPMLAHSGAARQRFLREAQATAAVVHPNIVPIFAISPDQELPHIVMPYIGGGNLQQLIDQNGPLPLQRTLAFGLQVAEGLAAAHQQGIIHRDIKPANLMLDEGGFRVMLTDFGLARALDEASQTGATLTGTGAVAGTPQYMSPEQARGEAVDHRTDLYALGAVLYALATGRTPITAASTLEILRKIGTEKVTPVAEINESYPLWFQAIVDRFMHPSKDHRIQSAQEACQLLRETLAHVRAPTRVCLPTQLKPIGISRPKRVLAGILLCSFATAIIAALGPWSSSSHKGSSERSPSTNTTNVLPDSQIPNLMDRSRDQVIPPQENWPADPSPAVERLVDWNDFEMVNQNLSGLENSLQILNSEIEAKTESEPTQAQVP